MDATIAMKRIEIVIDEEKLEELIALFNEVGVRGYTFIKQAGGLGSRGTRRPVGHLPRGRAVAPGPFLPTVLASAVIDRLGDDPVHALAHDRRAVPVGGVDEAGRAVDGPAVGADGLASAEYA